MTALVVQNDFLRVKEEDYNLIIAKFNMTEKMVRESIDSIHQWYNKQPHLPEGAWSDGRILRFLLATDFSLEKMKQKIDNLMTARNMIPELLVNRDPCGDRIRAVYKYMPSAILPQRLDDMSRIIVTRINSCDDLTNFNLYDALKMSFMIFDFRLSLDLCNGEHRIIDLQQVQLGHVAQCTPTLIEKTLFTSQGCFGSKIKGIHFLNIPHYAKFVISLMKAGLTKKMSGRLHVHKSYESLHHHFPKSILPSDMGGENKSTAELADDTYEQLKKPEWREWFLKQDQFKSDESKRVGTTGDMANHLLGTQGSFRKLDID